MPPKSPPRRFRFPRRLLFGLALLILLLLFAPIIVANTGLLGWAVHQALPAHLADNIQLESASLAWWSPVVLQKVTFKDKAGNVVFQADEIATRRTLFGLATNSSRLGTVVVRKPLVNAVFQGNTSNLELLIASPTSRPDAQAASPASSTSDVSLSLEIENGILNWAVADTQTVGKIHLDRARITLPDGRDPLQIHAHGNLQDAGDLRHAFEIETTLQPEPANPSGLKQRGKLVAKLESFPLVLAGPLVRRFEPGLQLSGRADVQVKGDFDQSANGQWGAALDGLVRGKQFAIRASWLNGDTLQFDTLELPCRLAVQGARIHVEQAILRTDLGQAGFTGDLDLAQPAFAMMQPGSSLGLDVDLALLARKLPKTLKLHQDVQVSAGRVQVQAKSTTASDRTLWDAKLITTDLRGSKQGKAIAWNQPVQVTLKAHQIGNKKPTIDSLQCQSGFLQATATGSTDEMRVALDMNLDKLAESLGQFVDLGRMNVTGRATGELIVRSRTDGYLLDGQLQLTNDLRVPGPALSVQVKQLALAQPPAGGIQLAGECILQGDLARMRTWQQDPKGPTLDPMQGLFRGQIKFHSQPAGWGFEHNLAIDNFLWGPTNQPTWREARLQSTGQGRYDISLDQLQLEQVRLFSQLLNVEAAGKVAMLTTRRQLDVQGRLAYDLAGFEGMVRPYMGKDVKLEGRDVRPFRLAGPLTATSDNGVTLTVASQLAGDATVAWKSVQALGSQIGPANLQTQLQSGWVRVAPFETTLNNGRLRLDAAINIASTPMELHIAKQQTVERAQLSPSLCKSALAYAVPALANATEAEGQVSLSLEKCRIPLGDMNKAEIRGTLVLHQARINGNPLLREIAGLLNAQDRLILQKEAVVPFQMVDGKVHHQNLELAFKDFTLKTSGTVGLDGTVALLAEMPLPSRWLPANLRNGPLAKQTIKVPIQGNLENPRVDPSAVENITRQLIRESGQNFLNRLLIPK